MEKREPIKRKELAPLSREHHDGLLLCWKINQGLSRNISPERISAYLIYFYDNQLNPHFNEEEICVFPLLDPGHPERIIAEDQHRQLREMVHQFRNHMVSADALKAFAELLNDHIRFEERVMFNTIEKETEKNLLKSLEENLKTQTACDINWTDQFWLK